ncbi:MAG: phage major capsid protein [Candidatus Thiodiazotropha sp.]
MPKEIAELIEEQGRAFEEFKSANDVRLKAIEEKGYAPADIVEKVDKIDGELNTKFKALQDELAAANRPAAPGPGDMSEEQKEYKTGLNNYLRSGESGGLRELEQKALSGMSDPDGGFLLDPVMDAEIDRIAGTVSSFRGLAHVVTIGGRAYKKLVKTRGVSGGHIGIEEESPGETQTQQFAEIEIVPEGIYAEPHVPNDLLEDVGYDLDGDIHEEVGITFGEVEGADFIMGTGVKMPRGILSYDAVANADYEWGKLGYVPSGAAGAFASSDPGDKIIDLQHSLKQQYRNGAVMMMADSALSRVRQMKDGTGNYYLFNPEPTQGFAGSVLGSPVSIDDFMPQIAANSFSIAYGNFRRGYKIVDRRGIAVIRDNVTKKGWTKLFFTKRVGGGINNFEAIKLMKFATS